MELADRAVVAGIRDTVLRPAIVDDRSCGRASARAQLLSHEAIVDVDVRAHLDLNV